MPKFKRNPQVDIQDAIRQKVGPGRLLEAELRLCKRCTFGIRSDWGCGLLPITSSGSDCPYFSPGETAQAGGTIDG